MAATGGLHRPMNRVAEGRGTGPVTYLGPLPGEGGVVSVAAAVVPVEAVVPVGSALIRINGSLDNLRSIGLSQMTLEI